MIGNIGKYRVVGELGFGGFARVYRAIDSSSADKELTVAIKLLNANDDPIERRRFEHEVKATIMLNHPNIITVHEWGKWEGRPFIVMELLDGEDLKVVISKGEPKLELLDKLKIMEQVAEGLHCAHQNGVTHRDIKPANIRLLNNKTVKIMDFGIALIKEQTRLTLPGLVVGTPEYMAPEQLKGLAVDEQSEIFSFGVMFYELLSGKNPFDGPTFESKCFNILEANPPPIHVLCPDLPMALTPLLVRALAKKPADRFESVDELKKDLKQIILEHQKAMAAGLLGSLEGLRLYSIDIGWATDVIRKASILDPTNADVASWERKLREESTRRKAEKLFEAADGQLSKRNFDEAVSFLLQARSLDESSEKIKSLLAFAEKSSKAKKGADQLAMEAGEAIDAGDLASAYQRTIQATSMDGGNENAIKCREKLQEKLQSLIGQAAKFLSKEAHDDAEPILKMASTAFPDQLIDCLLFKEEKGQILGLQVRSEVEKERSTGGNRDGLALLRVKFASHAEIASIQELLKLKSELENDVAKVEKQAEMAWSLVDENKAGGAIALLLPGLTLSRNQSENLTVFIERARQRFGSSAAGSKIARELRDDLASDFERRAEPPPTVLTMNPASPMGGGPGPLRPPEAPLAGPPGYSLPKPGPLPEVPRAVKPPEQNPPKGQHVNPHGKGSGIVTPGANGRLSGWTWALLVVGLAGLAWLVFNKVLQPPEPSPEYDVFGNRYVRDHGGAFRFGCSSGDLECDPSEIDLRSEKVAKPILIGETEVTVGAYMKFAADRMPPAPTYNADWASKEQPVVGVSWGEAKAYCTAAGGRLPNEFEWEHAARGGSARARYGTQLKDIAWYDGNSATTAQPVRQRKANAFGLYDVLGNVLEWTDSDYGAPEQASEMKVQTSLKVARGGSFSTNDKFARVSKRIPVSADAKEPNLGFRCVREDPAQ